MTFLVHRTLMFLLLLMCGPALYQATSCPYLDVVSILSGHFYIEERDGIRTHIKVFPVDIPALNQYFPLYYTVGSENQTHLELICLFVEWGKTIYGSVTYTNVGYVFDSSKYRTPELDLSTMTRYDIPAVPECTENSVLNGDIVESTINCNFNGQESLKIGTENCTFAESVTTVVGLPPSLDPPLPEYRHRIATYPIPASWLIGSEDYVNLCSA